MSMIAHPNNDQNALAALCVKAGNKVTHAVKKACDKTDIDFGYLLKQAQIESGFDTDIQAKTSSARGLFQFIESTWLQMIDQHGGDIGINTAQSKDALLKLRDDPEIAAHMAAKFASGNKAHLEQEWRGDVGATELYLAHFLGAEGASQFLKATDQDSARPAADLFPSAAKSNYNIFYDKSSGRAKSLQEVYDSFSRKFVSVDGGNKHQGVHVIQAGDQHMDKDFARYAAAAQPYFGADVFPNAANVNLQDLFKTPNRPPLSSGALWSMKTLDFVNLLKSA